MRGGGFWREAAFGQAGPRAVKARNDVDVHVEHFLHLVWVGMGMAVHVSVDWLTRGNELSVPTFLSIYGTQTLADAMRPGWQAYGYPRRDQMLLLYKPKGMTTQPARHAALGWLEWTEE